MSSKKCIYQNCSNTGAGEITLFAFPKDPLRRDLWLQLSGRSGHTLQKSDCLCELHFGRQFISSNQRRKVLVGISVPFPFDQTESQTENDDEALDDCDRLNEIFDDTVEQHRQEEVHCFASNTVMEHIEHVTAEDCIPETIICEQSEIPSNEIKRKVSNSTQNGVSQPVKLIKIEVNKVKPKNGMEAPKTVPRKDETKQKPSTTNIIDHPDVSIFNIRGEEFIQMPKSVYLEEKTNLENRHTEAMAQEIKALREELNKYKSAVHIIKNQLKTLP